MAESDCLTLKIAVSIVRPYLLAAFKRQKRENFLPDLMPFSLSIKTVFQDNYINNQEISVSIREQITTLELLSSIDSDILRINEKLQQYRTNPADALKTLDARIKADQETLSSMEKQRAALPSSETEEIGRLNSTIESAQLAINELLAKRSATAQATTANQNSSETLLKELEGEAKARNEERAKVVAKLPPALYRRYESIRARRPVAIAKTHDGTCLGCHLSVPPEMFQKLRRQEEFERCPNCNRILYYMPPEAAWHSDPTQ